MDSFYIVRKSAFAWLVTAVIVCIGAVLAVIALPTKAAEQTPANLSVKPVSQRVNLRTDQELTGYVEVMNNGDITVKFKVSAVPYWVQDDNYNLIYDKFSKHTELARWISFEQTDYTLEAKQTAKVAYKITTPQKNLPSGGQYAAVLAEFSADSSADSTGVLVKGRVGTVLFANLGGNTKKAARVVKNQVPWLLPGPSITVESLVENTGNIDVDAKYTLKVNGIFGSGVCKDTDDKTTNNCGKRELAVLPDTKRRVELTAENVGMGVYWVNQSVTVLGQTSSTSHLVIVAPWAVIVAAICLLAAMVAGIVLTVARHIKRKKSRTPKYKLGSAKS
ncbi:MAG: hypothetical protein LBL84_01110 [Candidatus Nomurabacteria bacterium]|jgi:hypothetical protein|nr:hypothetical protein [Candidatus Nomurabacteria bacterium]